MDKLKKVFSPGSSKDDEATSGQYGASTNVPHPTETKPSDSPQLVTDPNAQKDSHGVMRQILNPNGEKYSEQSHGTTATQAPTSTGADRSTTTGPSSSTPAQSVPQDSSQWREEALAGLGAAGGAGALASSSSEGLQRQQRGDDVSDSTYTARSYQLAPGSHSEPQGPERTVQPTDTTYAGEPRNPEYIRDGSLAGAGTIIGAGGVSEADLASQENKPKDEDVANATYTDRAYPAGGPGTYDQQGTFDPLKVDSASRYGPHIPGEFPTDTGEDPHVHGAFPLTPGVEADRGLGSNGPVSTGLGEGGVLGAETTPSDAAPPAAQDESHLGRDAAIMGGGGAATWAVSHGVYDDTQANDMTGPIPQSGSVPTTTATEPVEAEPVSEHHYGRDAAIAGGGVAATGAAGYGIYEATRADETSKQPLEDQKVSTTTALDHTEPEPATEHQYGRDAAIAGGATAATGAAGYGIYEATRPGDTSEQTLDDRNVPATTAPEPTQTNAEPQHHYGRDAAIAGGATATTGAAGYGVYEATKGDDARQTVPDGRTMPDNTNMTSEQPTTTEKVKNKLTKKSSTKEKPSKAEPTKTTPTRPVQTEATRPEERPDEIHYGRDAAIVGGTGAVAGAAGYGAHEATRDDPNDTGPASKTIGPHESNAANILDPRVKPEPEKMKSEPTTTGPYKSDMANKADPRVQSDSTKAQKTQLEENAHTRDAAVAGGAGATGAGTYEASQRHETPSPSEPSRTSYESPNNKTSVDSHGHHHLHKKSVEQQGEKKPGLVSRILHPSRTKQEKEEREAARRSLEHPADYQQSGHVGTDGQIGDPNYVSGMEGSQSATEGAQR